jgi:Fe-S oxidoreductase
MTELNPALQTYLGIPAYVFGWIVFVLGVGLFLSLIYRRYLPLRTAQADPRFDALGPRVLDLLRYGFLQTRQPRYLWAGVIHLIIFWGFMVLGLRSVELIAQGLNVPLPLPPAGGFFGRAYGSLKDLFELLVLAACIWAALRRALLRPNRYEGSHSGEAYLVLGLISCLMVTDIIYEGSGLVQLHEGMKGAWSPAADFAASALSGLHANVLTAVREASFWLHLLIFFSFLNLLPASKHFHIITALPNIFLKKRKKGTIKPVRWDIDNLEDLESLGVSKIEDFTWKHILDFYTCTECGRCSDNCPATTVGRPLSPKMLTMKLRDLAYSRSPALATPSAKQKRVDVKETDEADGNGMVGSIISTEELWSCTTCGACEEECPVFIEYIDKMVDMRRHLIETAQNPTTFNPILMNVEKTGNPFGKPPSKRADWIKDVSGVDIRVVKPGDAVDMLYFVDGYGAFDPRIQSVAAAIARGLHRAGIDFGILGAKEKDSGHQVRRLGEEGLFELLREENTETLSSVRMKRIVTTDPHAFNCLKNDYNLPVEVSHYTQVLWELIQTGKLTPKRSAAQGSTVTYHDPCYLGRHNGIYDGPREIIKAIPGLKFVEMKRCRDRSFCCGGGDVSLWHEIEGEQMRMAQKRLDMALDSGADLIVTACPFCLIHLEDAVKTRNMEGRIRVADLMELFGSTIEEG